MSIVFRFDMEVCSANLERLDGMMKNRTGATIGVRNSTQGVYPMMPKAYTAARRAELRAFEKKIVKRLTARAK